MYGKPWASAGAPTSSAKVRCSPQDLRIRFLPTPRFVRCTWARISNCRLGSESTMLKPSLQLRIGQQLTMTPQLQQAIRLLQLPSLDLQAHVRETLETNVMLEAEDELALDALPEGAREREDVPGPAEEKFTAEEKYSELDGNTAAAEQTGQPEVEIVEDT